MHLAALSRACPYDLLAMPVEDVLSIRCNEAGEGLSDQLLPIDAE
jgi:hypothetical protein